MCSKTVSLVSATVFGLVAAAHLWRAVAGSALVIGGWSAPVWLSGVAAAGAALLCAANVSASLRRGRGEG
jgi:hypothetical protein